jgi:hypothetical protein
MLLKFLKTLHIVHKKLFCGLSMFRLPCGISQYVPPQLTYLPDYTVSHIFTAKKNHASYICHSYAEAELHRVHVLYSDKYSTCSVSPCAERAADGRENNVQPFSTK